jgi:hypothetical protein
VAAQLVASQVALTSTQLVSFIHSLKSAENVVSQCAIANSPPSFNVSTRALHSVT